MLETQNSTAARALSDRAFGLALAVMAGTLALGPLLFGRPARFWLLGLALLLSLTAQKAPASLAKVKAPWLRVTGSVGALLNAVVLGFLFYFFVTPLALVFRVLGRDILGRKFLSCPSYWEERLPDRTPRESFRQQF